MKCANRSRVFYTLGAMLVALSLSHVAIADTSESGVQGIHTGSAQGIHTGSVEGIHTGSVEGIHTGSVEGIHTGSIQGIHTGSILGIHTGSILGIHTGSVEGIHTGSVEGIHTGSVEGIHSGSVTHLVLSAPVSSININNGVFTAVGQTVFAAADVLHQLAPGDYVNVYGSVSGPGYLYADSVTLNVDPYVPGASTVLVAGIATDIDRSLGRAKLGGLDVDYTPALSSGHHPESGFVTFKGILPAHDSLSFSGVAFQKGLTE